MATMPVPAARLIHDDNVGKAMARRATSAGGKLKDKWAISSLELRANRGAQLRHCKSVKLCAQWIQYVGDHTLMRGESFSGWMTKMSVVANRRFLRQNACSALLVSLFSGPIDKCPTLGESSAGKL
jgi:hypothetical protein